MQARSMWAHRRRWRKIATTAPALGLSRFDLKYSAGPLPHEKLMRSIELYGKNVIPLVRNLLNAT